MVKKECLSCGKEFQVRNYRGQKGKYCCRECVNFGKSLYKKCLFCFKEFRVRKSLEQRTKFCSKKCREDYQKSRRGIVICEQCNKEFEIIFSKKDKARFCSYECKKKFNDSDTEKVCEICKKKFIKKKWQFNKSKKFYCSKKCYNKRCPKVFVKCSGCNKDMVIYPSRKKYYKNFYCSNECRLKYGLIGKLTENNNYNLQYQKFIRSIRHTEKYYKWKKNCLERDKYVCKMCGSIKKITVHHMGKSMYNFVMEHGFDKNNIYNDPVFFDINNGETLCRRCHFLKHIKKGGNDAN